MPLPALCVFSTYKEYLVHVRQVHRNDTRFQVYCDISNCTKSWPSFKNHVSRYRRNSPATQVCGDVNDLDNETANVEASATNDPQLTSEMLHASYMLSLETSLRLKCKSH